MLNRVFSVLIVIDIQGNLYEAMQDKEKLMKNALQLVKGAQAFNLPIIATEQIPEKLGRTIPALASLLTGITPISKETFSCWENKQFRTQIETAGRKEAIITGIESHVCVYQTAVDLLANGYKVSVVADAVSSRTKENCDIGIAAMKNAGAQIASAEMILFELLRTAGDARFKDIYKIVR